MDDKELLELAAKAAGYAKTVALRTEWHSFVGLGVCGRDGYRHDWNPLKNDRDALHLAVKLKIGISHDDELPYVWVHYLLPGKCSTDRDCEEYGDDAYAATRRAIVKAAAAMAKEPA